MTTNAVTTSRTRQPRVYFSFRSPYSWLACHDLITGQPQVTASLEWRPFWEPDALSERLLTEAGGRFIYTPMSREKHRYLLGDVRRLTRQRGLSVTWPIDRDPWWEVSHLGYLVAAQEGRGMEFIERVYRARWQEGKDISDRATIADLAAAVGVSRATAERAVDDEQIRRSGVEALLSVHHDDVFGVPFFINRGEKFWGVDRLSAFLESVAGRPGNGHPPKEADAAGETHVSDYGHAGGCG